MSRRRQALRFPLQLAVFHTPILSAKFSMFALLSAVTPYTRRCHRRDHASPRRIWRRI